MKVLVIGGTGHIGRFLVPMLDAEGHDVVCLTSGRSAAKFDRPLNKVQFVTMKYSESIQDGTFGKMLDEKRFDTVIDVLQEQTPAVYLACKKKEVGHLVVCGSLWMFGRPKIVPTPEIPQTECPFPGYLKRFSQMQDTIALSRREGGPAVTAIMPPNICGPGKVPIDGMGGRSVEVHLSHRRGEPVILPFPGTNLIGPCDAEDIARAFYLAVMQREKSGGEIFNVGSAYALTAERFIQTLAQIYKTTIPIQWVSPERYMTEISPDLGDHFHFLEHMCPDISKIRLLLGYGPRYTPQETLERAIRWMEKEMPEFAK
ncbi:MAG: NAD(P)-dependent oxidoreductase [Phycisphaerae bacterium]|nr:NAD(P)-dependent oxidoreductase [Phycisphaerae bacterium]